MEIIALMLFLYFSNFNHNVDFSLKSMVRPENSGTTIFTIQWTCQILVEVTSLACSSGFSIRNIVFFTFSEKAVCFLFFPYGCQRDWTLPDRFNHIVPRNFTWQASYWILLGLLVTPATRDLITPQSFVGIWTKKLNICTWQGYYSSQIVFSPW